jgi:hypothetical protein
MGAHSHALGSFLLTHHTRLVTRRIEPICLSIGLEANLSLPLSTAYLPKSLPENVLRFSLVVTGVLQIRCTRV